eukprot:231102-Rhodomonas_salina.1
MASGRSHCCRFCGRGPPPACHLPNVKGQKGQRSKVKKVNKVKGQQGQRSKRSKVKEVEGKKGQRSKRSKPEVKEVKVQRGQ